ncbi:diacylglycerol/lipid kinase family protein [Caenimonas terrae]|uniref:Diacylglycerol/lipid kinase family protein n=1 Tax=Caenimonas terrae TaxID=696074 RepID=A0ABW0NBP4_9BURK
MADRIPVIVNATAGNGSNPAWADGLQENFAAAGLQVDLKVMQQGSEIAPAVAAAVKQGARLVVAGGGDGTVSAVAAGLAGTGVALGVLPMGTLNHFAKDLGIPLEQQPAIAVIAAGRQLEVDVGEVNGRVFINNSSLGLYPDIVRDREQRQRRLGQSKWRALLEASITAARRYPVLTVQVEVDGQTLTRRTPFVFIGNNQYTMEGFEIGERSALNCGELSLYLTHRMGRFGLLRLAVMALLHRLDQARDFDMLTARDFMVKTGHRRLRVATDGEVTVMEAPLRYRIRPAALRVMVPAPQEQAP